MTKRIHTNFGLLAILLWSTTVAVTRSMSEQVGPLTAACAVYLFGGGLSVTYLLVRGQLFTPGEALSRRYLLGCGSLFVIYMIAFYAAMGAAASRQQVLEVGLVNYLWPTLTLLFSVPLLNKRPSLLLLPGMLLASAGVFLVATQNTTVSWAGFADNLHSNPSAYAFALVAAVSWGFYSNLSRRWAEGVNSNAVTGFMLATGLVLLALLWWFPEKSVWTLRVVLEIVFMGVATALSYVFWDIAMRKGDMVLVTSCSYLTPFLATLVACYYLDVGAGWKLWAGCVLIIAGAVLAKKSLTPKEVHHARSLPHRQAPQVLPGKV
jgi:drug/metabolite transporter (DMT)-like permease